MDSQQKNPLGLLGFDSLDFTTDSLMNSPMIHLFETLGMSKVSEEKKTNSVHFQQNRIHFTLSANEDPHSLSRQYFQKHGEGVYQMNFLVKDAQFALKVALERGAEMVEDLKRYSTPAGDFAYASIKGVGDVINQFVQRPMNIPAHEFQKIRHHFTQLDAPHSKHALSQPLLTIDHLTNNVPKGKMDYWVEFYQRIFGFEQTRYFDIKGLKTGLLSKVVQLVGTNIIIPINEPEVENGKSQIQEYLDVHKGPGVQHIALTTTNIIKTVMQLKEREMRFLSVPETYYEDIAKRNFSVSEDIHELAKNKILVDGDPKGYLLQIFTDTYVGPSFFEIIQRKNHLGFGEGNFQALFDSIERDQIQRGYLK